MSKRFTERGGAARLGDEPHTIAAIGLTAGVVNGNGRLYPAPVVKAAVDDLRSKLNESAGQGRLLLGEAEHPSDKGSGRPNLLETVVRWTSVEFNEASMQVLLSGQLLETQKGRDILALLEGGVIPDVSQRGYGESRKVRGSGSGPIEEVTKLSITGYDLVLEGSDPYAGVTMFEAREGDEDVTTEIDEKQGEAAKPAPNEGEVRAILGLRETDDLASALRARERRLAELEESEARARVAAYVEEQTRDLAYPAALLAQLVEATKAAAPKTLEEAKQLLTAKRREYDGIVAGLELGKKGFVRSAAPVIEAEAGVPAFASAGWAIQESLQRTGHVRVWNPGKPRNINERFAAQYLARFDQLYRGNLLAEARQWEEAEQTSDLSLPYSVMRAVIAEAFPDLVSTGIFDVGMTDQNPMRIYFEAFSGETGYTGTVTDEAVTTDRDAWVALAHARVTPGSAVVTSNPAGTTYTEGTDYVIDYENGKLMTIATIVDGASVLVDYTYTAIREGEMSVIPYGKLTLTAETLEMQADRLAQQISHEAIAFSRSQLGWDAVTRTLASLVKQIRRKVDLGLIWQAIGAVAQVSSNTGGTYDISSSTLDDYVKYLGVAKVKVVNRYYQPTAILLSATNSDYLSNWEGFMRTGFPNADLEANGFVGRLKGLPVYESTEMSELWGLVFNRELVMHRIFQPMRLFGPYPSYDITGASGKLVAADQYYVEEYSGSMAPVPQKGAYIRIQA